MLRPSKPASQRRRRGPRRFAFTYADIAVAAGLATETVQRKATGKRREFQPSNLESLVLWLTGRILTKRAQESSR